jgi:hypothetical protein
MKMLRQYGELYDVPEAVFVGELKEAAESFADAECESDDPKEKCLLAPGGRRHKCCRASLLKEIGLS